MPSRLKPELFYNMYDKGTKRCGLEDSWKYPTLRYLTLRRHNNFQRLGILDMHNYAINLKYAR